MSAMNLESLRALQKRIREATGPDRELDAEIFATFNNGIVFKDYCDVPSGYICRVRIGRRIVSDFPDYTTDPDGLGACVALIEAALPEANCIGFDRTPLSVIGYVSRNYVKAGGWLKESERTDRNTCLALLESAIAARIAELEAEQEKQTEFRAALSHSDT